MREDIVDQFLKSEEGGQALQELTASGLAPDQAEQALRATVEGTREHARSGGLLSQGGGLGSLAGGLLGGHETDTAGALGGLAGPIAQVVSTRTGLPLERATLVVGTVLPRLLSLLHAKGATQGAGVGGLLRNL